MAIASVAARGAQTYAALGTTNTFTLTTPNTIAVGNTLFFFLAMDNSFTAGAGQLVQLSFTLDPGAGAWIPIATATNDPGAANEGVQIYAWFCNLGRALAGGETLSMNAAVSVGRAVASAHEFSGAQVRGVADLWVTNTGNGTTATAPALLNTGGTGKLVVAMSGVESNAAITGDADTTDGSWVTINTASSNSGVATTSIAAMVQYKITTGTTTQNWASTWAGAADWAAMAALIALEDTVDPRTSPPSNQNWPCIAGPEILPTQDATLPVDTGTGYGVVWPWLDSSDGQSLFWATAGFVDPNARCQHTISFEMLDEPRYVASFSDDITTLVLPLREVAVTDPLTGAVSDARTNSSGGTLVNPTNSMTLANKGGNKIWFDGSSANAFLDLFFDTAILANYTNYRVVRVGLRYVAFKDDSSPAEYLGEGFDVSWVDTQTVRAPNTVGAQFLHGSWLAPDYERNAQYQTRWLGETNHISRNNFHPDTQSYKEAAGHPFTIADLNFMNSGVEQMYVKVKGQQGFDLLQTDVYMDYIEMIVEIAPERRLYVGTRQVSNINALEGLAYRFDPAGAVKMNYSLDASASAAAAFATDTKMIFHTREAFPASSSDRYRVSPDGEFLFTYAEAIGPSLEVFGVETLRNRQQISEVGSLAELPRFFESNLVGGLPQVETFKYVPFIFGSYMYDLVNILTFGPYWVEAQRMSYPSFRYAAVGSTVTVDVPTNGTVTYDLLRVFVRPELATTATLDFEIRDSGGILLSTASLTVFEWEIAGDEFVVGDELNYREVLVVLDTPITPIAPYVTITALSSTSPATSWDVASIFSTNKNFAYEWFRPSGQDNTAAMVLTCELDVPDVTVTTVEVAPSSDAPCITTPINIPSFHVDNADIYDWIVILRRSMSSSDFLTLAVIDVSDETEIDWLDVGVPWDVPASDLVYLVFGWRDADRRAAVVQTTWDDTATAPGAAFGLADYDSSTLYPYVPVSSGDLEVTWNPLTPIDTAQLHGQDFQVALRSPEDRGLSVTVTVAVRDFEPCDAVLDADQLEDVGIGQNSLTPHPFRVVRELEKLCRLQLSLPGGHTRWVSLDLGPLTVHTSKGVYLAEITLTDLPVNLSPSPYETIF